LDVNPYDRALFRRALLALGVLTLVAFAIVWATDEATSTLGMRLARLSALSPLLTATALLGIGAHARARGELRALLALGATPWRALRGAELAGLALAVASLVVLLAPFTDATSLLPAVHPATTWTFSSTGTSALAPGVVVYASGALNVTGAALSSPPSRTAAWAALPCVAPIAFVVPPWASTPMPFVRRAWSAGATSLLAVMALHLVAANRMPPPGALAASVPIAIALWRSRKSAQD
jgi:hypothetical protein